MSILTKDEVRKFVYGSKRFPEGRSKHECIFLLEDFQKKKTSRYYIHEIDSLIPKASSLLEQDKVEFERKFKQSMPSALESKTFHKHMNDLARKAGLRR